MDRKHAQLEGKLPPGVLFFTLKVPVGALLILPVIIQVQFKSLRQNFYSTLNIASNDAGT